MAIFPNAYKLTVLPQAARLKNNNMDFNIEFPELDHATSIVSLPLDVTKITDLKFQRYRSRVFSILANQYLQEHTEDMQVKQKPIFKLPNIQDSFHGPASLKQPGRNARSEGLRKNADDVKMLRNGESNKALFQGKDSAVLVDENESAPAHRSVKDRQSSLLERVCFFKPRNSQILMTFEIDSSEAGSI